MFIKNPEILKTKLIRKILRELIKISRKSIKNSVFKEISSGISMTKFEGIFVMGVQQNIFKRIHVVFPIETFKETNEIARYVYLCKVTLN